MPEQSEAKPEPPEEPANRKRSSSPGLDEPSDEFDLEQLIAVPKKKKKKKDKGKAPPPLAERRDKLGLGDENGPDGPPDVPLAAQYF